MSKKTNKRIIIIILYLIIAIILFLAVRIVFNNTYDVDLKLPDGTILNVDIEKPDLQKHELEKEVNKSSNYNNTIEDILANERNLSKSLRDSLETLRYQNKLRLNAASDLLRRFNGYELLSNDSKKQLVTEVLYFLDVDNSLNRNYSELAVRVVNVGKNQYNTLLESKIKKLEEENKLLKTQLSETTKIIKNLNITIKKLNEELVINRTALNTKDVELAKLTTEYKSALSRINSLYSNMNGLREDKSKLIDSLLRVGISADQLESLNFNYASQLDSIKKKVENLEIDKTTLKNFVNERDDQIKSFKKFAIDNVTFKPNNAKRRKDQTYPNNFNSISINLQLKKNYINNSVGEKIKIILLLPSKRKGLQTKVFSKLIKYNTPFDISIKKGDKDDDGNFIKFESGTYTIQIIHDNSKVTNPITEKSFVVRKFLSK